MPRDLLAPVFELAPNATTMIERAQSFAVMQLLSVTPADLSGEAAPWPPCAARRRRPWPRISRRNTRRPLRARANVRINPRLVDQMAGN
jgi:peptidyl-prolyl cis-trans isomerase D